MRRLVQSLRERGIYALPDGKEFVVHAVFRGGYLLYAPEAWEFFGRPYSYETNEAGQIRSSERATHWRIEDLIDTERTARSRSRNGAAEKPLAG
jgi:hypothetical protein